ncbi:MAG: IS110 family transposase [Chloroflexota bacterium]|nr:IS110 family transposase [Chloroflexota bacterium]
MSQSSVSLTVRQPRRTRTPTPLPTVDCLQQLNLHAAGVDVGAAEIWVAVPAGRSAEAVRVFGTFTMDLQAIADWLEACGVETVAMESTGIYWIPLYEILEARGLAVQLVNAKQVKNVTGRKSDLLDCQWIQQLHTYGLLSASFRPPEEICALRSLVRHRETLLQARAVHIQHMQKALHLMNLQLTNVLTDITGQTGLQIIRAIVAGEHDPHVLARYRHVCCAKSEADIAKALEGHYKSEHLFVLQQALELYDVYSEKVAACDAQIEQCYTAFESQVDPAQPPLPPAPRKRRSKNTPTFDLRHQLYQLTGVDLTAIDGIDVLTAQTIVAEVGLDMSRWPTVKHFASWLGLAPQHDMSGGKLLRQRTKRTQNRAATALRLAAQSVSRSQSAVGAFYRRIRAKHGPAKAVTATAHKLARIIYTMLRDRTPYHDLGADYYDDQAKQRAINNLKRRAKQLGLEVVPAPGSATEVS